MVEIKVYLDQEFDSQDQIYQFLARQYASQDLSEETIIQDFLWRESLGSIEIAAGLVLPHLESDKLEESQIVLIGLDKPISKWSQEIANVSLVMALLISPQSDNQAIIKWMRKLGQDDFVQELLTGDESKIKNIVEEFKHASNRCN